MPKLLTCTWYSYTYMLEFLNYVVVSAKKETVCSLTHAAANTYRSKAVVWSLHALFTSKHTLLSSRSEDPGNPAGDKSTIA